MTERYPASTLAGMRAHSTLGVVVVAVAAFRCGGGEGSNLGSSNEPAGGTAASAGTSGASGNLASGNTAASGGSAGAGGDSDSATSGGEAPAGGAGGTAGSNAEPSAGAGGTADESLGVSEAPTDPVCTDACGGDPVGTWELDVSRTCGLALETPESEPVVDFNPCPDAHADEEGVFRVDAFRIPYWQSQPATSGSLALTDDGTYLLSIQYEGVLTADIPDECLSGFSPRPTCAELAAEITRNLAVEPNISAVACTDGPDDGCACTLDALRFSSAAGTYSITENRLALNDQFHGTEQQDGTPLVLSSEPVFCVSDDTLVLGPELRMPGRTDYPGGAVFTTSE